MIKPIQIILMVLLLLLSFFFASAENVYTTVNKLRIERDLKDNKKLSKTVYKIVHNFNDATFTVLFGNNLVNIALTSIVASVGLAFDQKHGGNGAYVTMFSTILFVVLLTFGEIFPKIIGLKFNYRLSYFYAMPFSVVLFIFWPFVALVKLTYQLISRPLAKRKVETDGANVYTEEELQIIVDEIEESGLIDEETSDLVRSALEFTETEAYEIMLPRVDVVALDIEDTLKDILENKEVFKYSRIPVYQDSIDHIVGILPTKVLLKLMLKKQKIVLADLITPALFVHHSKRISTILSEFKTTKNHIAVVIDEYGGTEGIITMEDIIEEIIGEIWDESDTVHEPIVKKSENHYIIDGGVNIEDVFELLEIEEDEETDYDTLGGWILDKLDRFAKVGDFFTYEQYEFKVKAVDGFAVEVVEITKLEEIDE